MIEQNKEQYTTNTVASQNTLVI